MRKTIPPCCARLSGLQLHTGPAITGVPYQVGMESAASTSTWDPLEQVPPRPHRASPCPGLLVRNLRDTVAMASQEDGDHELN